MKMKKRLLSILLSLALVLGLMPGMSMTVHAVDYVASVTIGSTTTEYSDFDAAVSAWSGATESCTLTLLENVTRVDNPISMSSGTKTFNLNGKNITKTGNTGSVFCIRGGNLTVNGTGTISGGKGMNDGESQDYFRGGGFYISNAEVTVTNATISGNQALWGGGVFVGGTGTFTMNNGTISANQSKSLYGWTSGGGVWIQDDGTFIMNGGTVTGNTAEDHIGGVHANSGTFKVSGAAVITGNTHSGSNSNVKGNITVIGTLTEGANIGVTMDSPGVFTNSENTTYNIASKFTSDNNDYVIGKYNTGSNAGQLFLGEPVAVTFNANGHGTAPDAQTVASGSLVTEPTAPTSDGYTFGGWYKEEACTTAWDFESDTASAATTLYANWTAVSANAPTISVQPKELQLTEGYTEGSVSVAASAAEGHTLSYQWYSNTTNSNEGGTEIDGATSASYAIPTGKSAGTTEYYYCKVTATRTDNSQTATATSNVATVEVNKAAATVKSAPTSKTLTYNGSAQELVTAGTAENGTMKYALGADATTAPTDGWGEAIPTGTEAKTYYVWYKAKGDDGHNDSEAAYVTSTISKKEISRTVTFKVVNGSWDDETTKDQTITLKGYEGDTFTLKADQIPAVGKKPANGFAAGSWNTTPDTSTAITGATTYTYTYTKASDEPSEEPSSKKASVKKAPTAKKLTYTGKDQKLVNAGTASNGKMYYAVTKNTTAPKASAYKTSIPTGKAAGTYYVWYKVKGNKGYKDSAVKKVKVTIAKKTEEEPFNFNTSFKVTQKDGQVTVTWNKVNGLSKVDAYVAYCGTNYPAKKFTSTTKNTLTIKKIAGKKIDLTKDFKLTLVGYGPDKKTKKSVSLHIAGKDNKKFTNVKSFTLSKASVSVKKGKSTKVSVKTYKLEDTRKKELSDGHAAKFRYRSTNPKIAKVAKDGSITGVKEGKCKVFVYTRNGLSRKITVTVTK